MEADEGRVGHLAPLEAAHARLKNEFTEDEKCHNLMRWLRIYSNETCLSSETGLMKNVRIIILLSNVTFFVIEVFVFCLPSSASRIWATSWEILFMPYANNKGADQTAHPRSLNSAFVVRCLDSTIHLVYIPDLSSLYLASVAAQASLSLPWSQTQMFSWWDSYDMSSFSRLK